MSFGVLSAGLQDLALKLSFVVITFNGGLVRTIHATWVRLLGRYWASLTSVGQLYPPLVISSSR